MHNNYSGLNFYLFFELCMFQFCIVNTQLMKYDIMLYIHQNTSSGGQGLETKAVYVQYQSFSSYGLHHRCMKISLKSAGDRGLPAPPPPTPDPTLEPA